MVRRWRGGWRSGSLAVLAFSALLVAAMLMVPGVFGSGCGGDLDNCGPYVDTQAAVRAAVALAPFWLLAIALLAVRFRSALIVFAVASLVMAGLTASLGSELPFVFRPLGLSTATGFVVYSIPLAVAAVAALLDLRRPPAMA